MKSGSFSPTPRSRNCAGLRCPRSWDARPESFSRDPALIRPPWLRLFPERKASCPYCLEKVVWRQGAPNDEQPAHWCQNCKRGFILYEIPFEPEIADFDFHSAARCDLEALIN